MSIRSFFSKQTCSVLRVILNSSLCVILNVAKNLPRFVKPLSSLTYHKDTNYLSPPVVLVPIFLIFLSVFPVYAQDVQLLDVTINEAKGDVEMILPNTFNWIPVPAEAGVTFSEGTQIRTGPRSNVSLVFADSSVVLVDSLTYMTVEQFFRSDNVVTTRINLIVGSIVSTLNDGTQFDNDYKIVTPSLTETLNSNEIKKVVSGAMYKDSVRTRLREGGGADKETGGYKKGPSAGQKAQERQRQRESSVAQ
ncbi:MAG: hypothetical protein V3U54_05110 [Thermodesulfobacteriota bacterium]